MLKQDRDNLNIQLNTWGIELEKMDQEIENRERYLPEVFSKEEYIKAINTLATKGGFVSDYNGSIIRGYCFRKGFTLDEVNTLHFLLKNLA